MIGNSRKHYNFCRRAPRRHDRPQRQTHNERRLNAQSDDRGALASMRGANSHFSVAVHQTVVQKFFTLHGHTSSLRHLKVTFLLKVGGAFQFTAAPKYYLRVRAASAMMDTVKQAKFPGILL